MIKKLRWKFIRITMLSVSAVLFLIILAVNAVNLTQSNASLDSVTLTILENGGSFGKEKGGLDRGGQDPEPDKRSSSDRLYNQKELPYSTRFFTVALDSHMQISGWDLRRIASVSEEDIPAIAEKILGENASVGWYKTFRYRLGQTPRGYLLVAVEATGVHNSLRSVLTITVLVGLGAFLMVFFLVTLLSGRAIKPISQVYDKQRQFITDASHELKTPLTVIAANTEVLSMTCGDNEWSDGILRQIGHMRALIDRMIQMSRLDEDTQTPVIAEFNISDALYDTAMTFSAPATTRGLTLQMQIQPDLLFSGDEGMIRQVFSILMDNGIKYCDPEGTIRVVGEPAPRNAGKRRISISVSNTFAAADALDVAQVFDRFYRGDKARTADHSYGLGLSIAKSIVEKHGGKLQSVKGDGIITFRLLL